MSTKVIATWSDDHLPCFSFEHEGKYFELWWTDEKLVGRLEMVEEGDITIEKVFKKYPEILTIIQDPTSEKVKEYWDDEYDESSEEFEFSVNAGMLRWCKNGNPHE